MENKLPQFEATHENIMSIINMLSAYEQSNRLTAEQVVKKYTQFCCGDLAALIKKFIPKTTIVLSTILNKEEMENMPYHFMIKVENTPTKTSYYYDINGIHQREGLESYVASILGRKKNAEVGFTTKVNQNRKIESSNTTALHCEKDIIEQPYMIASGVFNRNKKL